MVKKCFILNLFTQYHYLITMHKSIFEIDSRCTQVRTTLSNGGAMVWRSIGQGPHLVLIHGGFGTWMHWIANIEVLSKKFTLWLPDMPCYGDSDDLTEQTLEGLVAGVLEGLNQIFDSGPIHLAAFSFGSLVAVKLAHQYSQIASLSLFGPTGHGAGQYQTMNFIDWQGVTDLQAYEKAMKHNMLALMLKNPDALDDLAYQTYVQSCERSRFRSRAISRGNTLFGDLDQFNGPTLFIWGQFDPTGHPLEFKDQLLRGLSHRRLELIPAVGHWVQYEASEQVNQIWMSWLSQFD